MVSDELLSLLEKAATNGQAGECAVCGRLSIHLVGHHWFELPDYKEHSCRACENCNAILYPDNLWVDANVGHWTGRPIDYIHELNHVLPSLEQQRWWLQELWEPWLYQGLDHVAPSPSFQATLLRWKESLATEYSIVDSLVTERNNRRAKEHDTSI